MTRQSFIKLVVAVKQERAHEVLGNAILIFRRKFLTKILVKWMSSVFRSEILYHKRKKVRGGCIIV